jgi:hypothetical protein
MEVVPDLDLASLINNEEFKGDVSSEFGEQAIGKHAQGAQYNFAILEVLGFEKLEMVRADKMSMK